MEEPREFRESRFIKNLDLNPEVVEGWEDFYDLLNVEVLRVSRQLGFRLPRVDVVQENGLYRLVYGMAESLENYGGHSRAVLALQEGDLLGCRVLDGHRLRVPETIHYHPISDLIPRQRPTGAGLKRLKENLDFLPNNIREKFIKEHSLVVLEDGSLTTQEDLDNPPAF